MKLCAFASIIGLLLAGCLPPKEDRIIPLDAERREARHCIGLLGGDWIPTYRNPAVILLDY